MSGRSRAHPHAISAVSVHGDGHLAREAPSESCVSAALVSRIRLSGGGVTRRFFVPGSSQYSVDSTASTSIDTVLFYLLNM